ncbi:phosphotransferase [Candidatus Hepatincola sp. Av]
MEENQILNSTILKQITTKVGSITKVQRLDKGLTNTLFVLENESNTKFIVKILSNIQGLLPNRHQEVYLNKLLWQKGLTAELLLYTNDFFLFSYLTGQNLTAKMLNKNILEQLNSIVNIINSTNLKSYKFFQRDFLQTARAYIQPLPDDLKNSQQVSSTLQLLKETVLYINKEFPLELALCHNDYNLNNFIVTPLNKLLVIDFEYAAINDIYFEYAGLNFMLGREIQNFISIHQNPIDIKKLKQYTVLLDCLSILWCYLMFVQHQVTPKPNYLAWANKVHADLFSK